ncbi:hypothetical protein [Streptomyces sp. NBRC 110028]|uniref:hypothetical protein n=1 Tax=Streptomyces sp. NBRC 110028 TaxID=1621260 RepID=UPI0006E1D7D8|nr:hypothetical protein [Streptomyces sp. NBRC 110028]
MALVLPPRTPAVAIARELRRLGLEQGRGKDFRVTGYYRNGERDHTYVLLLTRRAEEAAAAHADDIERWTAASPYPFRVSVRYFGNDRPTVSIAHAGDRIRETPPAPAAQDAPTADELAKEPAAPTPAPQAPVQPVADYREEHRQEEQAKALGWSTDHADAVRWAAVGELVRDADGVPRRVTRPGRTGRRGCAARLAPLAGFLVTGEADEAGLRPVTVTADGRRALLVWDRKQPAPVPRTRKQERQALRPLRYGAEERRRAEEVWADIERRRVTRRQGSGGPRRTGRNGSGRYGRASKASATRAASGPAAGPPRTRRSAATSWAMFVVSGRAQSRPDPHPGGAA